MDDPYRTPTKPQHAVANRARSTSRLEFAGKSASASVLVAFFLYMIVSYIRLGNTGGDGYIIVPIAAVVIGGISWLATLPFYSLANTHTVQLVACSTIVAALSLAYLFLIGAFATNQPILNPSMSLIVISLLAIPFTTGMISALNALNSNRDVDSQDVAG